MNAEPQKPFDRTTNGWIRKDGKVVPSHKWTVDDYIRHIADLEMEVSLLKQKISSLESSYASVYIQCAQHRVALSRAVGTMEDALTSPTMEVPTWMDEEFRKLCRKMYEFSKSNGMFPPEPPKK